MADSSSGDPDELLHEACKAGDVEKLREAILPRVLMSKLNGRGSKDKPDATLCRRL